MSRLLATHTVEKVWGRRQLPPPFDSEAGNAPVGEIWFDPPAELPQLLVKYLFTSDKLSVQVHPDDAAAGEGASGKEECWLILDAEPGAQLAIGLDEACSLEALRNAAEDGSIEGMLSWHEVAPGDFFYLPAGTIHAIGAGISLIEVQQNSDTTYRLYDYGRPRDLHLDQALRVARREPYDRARWHRRIADDGEVTLVDGPHFRLRRIDGLPGAELARSLSARALLVPTAGHYRLGGEVIAPGACALVEDSAELSCSKDARALIAQPC